MPKYKTVQTRPKVKAQWAKPPDKVKSQKDFIKTYMKTYSTLYVFSYRDVRSNVMTYVSNLKEWKNSKIIFGRNKVIIATLQELKRTNSPWPDLEKLLNTIKGHCGLLFTSRPPWQVKHWFSEFSIWDYPHAGYQVNKTIVLNKGPLTIFQPEIEPYLKQLGMPTTVENGVVTLTMPFIVCKEKDVLTFRQVHFLELLGEKISVFQLHLKASWTRMGGLEVLANDDDSDIDEDF